MFLYALESQPDATDWQEQLAEDMMWYVGEHFSLYDHGMRVNDVKKQLRDIRLRVNYKVPLEPDQQRLWAEFNAFWDNEGSPFITEFSHMASAAAEKRDLEEEKSGSARPAARVTVNADELGRLRKAARDLAALKSGTTTTKPCADGQQAVVVHAYSRCVKKSASQPKPRARPAKSKKKTPGARRMIPVGALTLKVGDRSSRKQQVYFRAKDMAKGVGARPLYRCTRQDGKCVYARVKPAELSHRESSRALRGVKEPSAVGMRAHVDKKKVRLRAGHK